MHREVKNREARTCEGTRITLKCSPAFGVLTFFMLKRAGFGLNGTNDGQNGTNILLFPSTFAPNFYTYI